jgi:predicted MFS family arabinose efflux permease
MTPHEPVVSTLAGTSRQQLVAGEGLSSGMVTLFAVAAGLAVANIYYAQPLLTSIAATFHVGSATAALIVTASTIGYTLGLALIVPLGDILNRRLLVVTLLLIVALAQVASALAPSIVVLTAVSGLLAVSAVVAPLMVSFAATLAGAQERGRVTGRVMSGVLLGVLLARTGAGLVAQLSGSWRTAFAVAAALMLVLPAVLYRALPDLPPTQRIRYLALLRSVVDIVREEPLLRMRCVYGFVSMAAFSALWASAAFLLVKPPYNYGEAVIGAFGLVGAAGAVAARAIGYLVDRGRDHTATGVLLLTSLVSWILMALHGGQWLVPLLIGVVLLDLGTQGMQVTNFSVIYRLRPEARNRITMAYTTTYFLGGAAGSALSGVIYASASWHGLCLVGGLLALLALSLWTVETLQRKRSSAPTRQEAGQ